DTSRALEPAVPAALGGRQVAIQSIALPLAAYRPDKREFVIADALNQSEIAIASAGPVLAAARPNGIRTAAQFLGSKPLQAAVDLAAMQRTLNQVATAELDLALTQARHEALAAIIQAERLEDSGKKDSAEWRQTAMSASHCQRKLAVLEAGRQVLQARE